MQKANQKEKCIIKKFEIDHLYVKIESGLISYDLYIRDFKLAMSGYLSRLVIKMQILSSIVSMSQETRKKKEYNAMKRKCILHMIVIILVPLLLLLLFNGIQRSILYAGNDGATASTALLSYIVSIVQYGIFGVFAYYISVLRFEKIFTIPFLITMIYLVLIIIFFPITPIVWRNFQSPAIPVLLTAVYALKLAFSLRKYERSET